MFPSLLVDRAAALEARCRDLGLGLATAESCTGGLLSALLTEIPGSSTVFERGFVVYSNEAKEEMLGVSDEVLAAHGAVSEATARAMALGALAHSRADIAVSVTGIAGPDGGTAAKPVGLVHLACARRGGGTVALERRFGALSRAAIRLASVEAALGLLEAAANESQPALRP
ncbi:MAG TPA: CinA family protein [Roseiarcus sp.]|nr:CinA family protein [Roseiarcus sp.]